MAGKSKLAKRSTVWWTRTRTIEGLKKFFKDFQEAPTSSEAWQERQQFTGIVRNGRSSHKGYEQKYPSTYGVLKHFKTFREAWTAAGIDVDRQWEAWKPEEDWFISEAVGIYSRVEIAEFLNRSPDAVHRRSYDLGFNARTRWGWTLLKASRVMSLPGSLIQKYLDYGDIPYFRGTYIYLDPADLLCIEEYDFTRKDIPAELENAIKRSLIARLQCILTGVDWRASRIYQPYPFTYQGRIKNRRPPSPKPLTRPNDLREGDWARIVKEHDHSHGAVGRVGQIIQVYWSNQRVSSRFRPNKEQCWMARIEFKKQKAHGRTEPRVRYSLPLAVLERANKPEGEITMEDRRRAGEQTSGHGRAQKRRQHISAQTAQHGATT